MTTKTSLPKCHARYCKNRARYSVPAYVDRETGKDGPMVDVCGTHRNTYEHDNASTHRRWAADAARDRNRDLADKLGDALAREAGISIGQVSVSTTGIELRSEVVERIVEWLS